MAPRSSLLLGGLSVLAVPTLALAHPGHGAAPSGSLGHLLVDHGALAVVVALALVGVGVLVARLRAR